MVDRGRSRNGILKRHILAHPSKEAIQIGIKNIVPERIIRSMLQKNPDLSKLF